MITGTHRYHELKMPPPFMERREVLFRAGAGASTGLGKALNRVNDAWAAEYLPFYVPIFRTHSPHTERSEVRKWLNKNVTGTWCFALPTDMATTSFAVRFSKEVEASAFRLFWG